MVHEPLAARAVVAAATEFGVQRIHHASVERAHLLDAEEGADVLLGIAAVRVERAELKIGFEEVPIEKLIDGRARARLSALINLVLQPADGLVCRPGGVLCPRRDSFT